MSFGERLRTRREELKISRADLAETLGVSRSAIGNYETGVSFPKEDIMLKLFDCLRVDPNYLYRDSYHGEDQVLSHQERVLLEKYRTLSTLGRETVRSVADTLCAYQDEVEQHRTEPESRTIPRYRSLAAVGYASPVCGQDYELIAAEGIVPRGAEFAVCVQGEAMAPQIEDGAVVYVNRDPVKDGEIGLFCADGAVLCRQYYRDPLGTVYLFALNRKRSETDVVFAAGGKHTLVCLGRVMMSGQPIPGKK